MAESVLRSFVRDVFASKYDPKEHDPEVQRIDGEGRFYPNCASDVWLRSCENEIIEPLEGHTSGHIPKWLNGSLLRNGPGNWKVGDMRFNHLFDCSALMHRFAIKEGKVTYQNRFIKTETYKKNMLAKRIVVTEFGTASVVDPCHSIFDRVSSIFNPENSSDNSMISIYPFGDEFYTFTETPFIHRINPRTLETEGRINVADFTGFIHHSSHPHVMANGTVYNLGTTMSKSGPAYNIVCFPHGESMFEDAYVVGTIPCRWKLHPGYMHTFGITENYFIIIEQPLSVSLPKYIKAHFHHQHLAGCLEWYENKPTLFHLVDRRTGKLKQTFQSEAFFYLHIINQYEEDDHIVIDLCCYKDASMIDCMYSESIMNMQTNRNYAAMFRGRPLRFVLPLGSNSAMAERIGVKRKLVKSFSLASLSSRMQKPKLSHSESQYDDITFMTTNCQESSRSLNESNFQMSQNVKVLNEQNVNLVTLANTKAEAYQSLSDRLIKVKPELICDLGCETPRVNYEAYLGKKYRYFYAISSDVDADNPGTLIKVDVVDKTCKTWCETNCYPSEPIFVPSPNSQNGEEDDGVILASMVWAGLDENHVGLLVLCARTFIELGRCEFHTNGPVPKCLHGWYAKDIL